MAIAAQRPLNRAELLEKLGECDRPALVAHVRSKNLPKATNEWSVEQIAEAVNKLHPLITNGKLTKVAAKAPVERQIHTLPDGPAYSIVYDSEEEDTTKVHRFKTREAAVEFTNDIAEGKTGHTVLRLPDLKGIPMSVLLVIANKNAETPIKKFASPDAARESVFNSLENASMETATKAVKAKAAPKVHTPRVPTPINYPAADAAKPVRAGTKIAAIIDLLVAGTTLEEIKEAGDKFGQPINARGWLGYDLKEKGYGAVQKGDKIFIVYPKGMRKPLPHVEKAEPTPKAKKVPAVKTLEEGQASAATKKPTVKKGVAAKKSPALVK